jgi:hypothetical protein
VVDGIVRVMGTREEAKTGRRGRGGAHWTPDEDNELVGMVTRGTPDAEIGAALERTISAVRSRVMRLLPDDGSKVDSRQAVDELARRMAGGGYDWAVVRDARCAGRRAGRIGRQSRTDPRARVQQIDAWLTKARVTGALVAAPGHEGVDIDAVLRGVFDDLQAASDKLRALAITPPPSAETASLPAGT